MSLDRERFERVRALFDELVDLPADIQAARLTRLETADPALHAELVRWLAADSDAETALNAYRFGAPTDDPSSALPESARDPLQLIGRSVNQFRVTGYVAAGGMGVVYRAQDARLGREVALKFPVVPHDLDRESRERFMNEARSAATLDHEHLCPVLEVGESEHGVYLAMPFYAGETLKQRLARSGAMPLQDALAIARQLAAGIGAAHAAGIVHRDLKPANVMVLPGDRVKILDFGLAKVRDVSLTRTNVTLGTVGYVAPEQVRGAAVDGRADLWAIGVMLYEMLTGVSPFRGDHDMTILHAVLHRDPPPVSAFDAALAGQVDALVDTLLQKEPEYRTASAASLLADIDAVARGEAPHSRPPFWMRTAARRRWRTRALPLLLLALVAGGSMVVGARIRDTRANAAVGAAATVRWLGDTALVTTSEQFTALLHPAFANRHVRLAPGVYAIAAPQRVPDGMTIDGGGRMRLDTAGMPAGLDGPPHATIRMTSSIEGDLFTLGNDVVLRGIEIVDVSGRSGNVLSLLSRQAADTLRATVRDVVIVNPNQALISPAGPTGRALLVATLNPKMGNAPAPHDGASVEVLMERSLIRSPSGGGGFFIYNFAANSRVSGTFVGNVIGGTNEANGGVSRPDAVRDSEARIVSRGNVYRNDWTDPCVSSLTGWNMTGGSGAPIPMRLPRTERNRLVIESAGDRFDGFTLAILATGARSFFPTALNDAPADNRIDLTLVDARISTPRCEPAGRSEQALAVPLAQHDSVADIRLSGSWIKSPALDPGQGNTVRAELRNVIGSGVRANRFEHVGGSRDGRQRDAHGGQNRLVLIGDPRDFERRNRGIQPAPAAQFFEPGRGAGATSR